MLVRRIKNILQQGLWMGRPLSLHHRVSVCILPQEAAVSFIPHHPHSAWAPGRRRGRGAGEAAVGILVPYLLALWNCLSFHLCLSCSQALEGFVRHRLGFPICILSRLLKVSEQLGPAQLTLAACFTCTLGRRCLSLPLRPIHVKNLFTLSPFCRSPLPLPTPRIH